MVLNISGGSTHDAKDERTVWNTRRAKKPVEIGGLGNQNTMSAARRANKKRGQ